MSKIGKKNIILPKDSSITIDGSNLTVSGPKGTKKLNINDKIFSSKVIDSEFQIAPLNKKIDKKLVLILSLFFLICKFSNKNQKTTDNIKKAIDK